MFLSLEKGLGVLKDLKRSLKRHQLPASRLFRISALILPFIICYHRGVVIPYFHAVREAS
ncbi:hypothetical protein W02_09310 [Nitrospira sp. KM1]|nr:hypothetical protein W02_09310 [Nitrospira sp. KM1]